MSEILVRLLFAF